MTNPISSYCRRHIFKLLTISMIVVGLFRITYTYSTFWQTPDEPFHIAAGMEWLDKGEYTYEVFHPPLARVMSALGPYLAGIRGDRGSAWDAARAKGNNMLRVEGNGEPDLKTSNWAAAWFEGNDILHAGGKYERNLILARIGILPFFIISSLVVALWARNYGGTVASILATFLFTSSPPILAHAGLATTDMACAAMATSAIFAFTLWLNRPTLLYSLILGVTTGLAILSKFSAIGFLLGANSLIVIYLCLYQFRKTPFEKPFFNLKRWARASIISLSVCFLLIWAGYRFSVGFLNRSDHAPYKKIDQVVGSTGSFHDVAYFILEKTPVPAPEFGRGIIDFFIRNNSGDPVYFLGKVREGGSWYYFPIVFLTKTPLPFILLSAIGIICIFRKISPSRHEEYRLLAPAIAVIGIFIIGMLCHVNNGIRQLLCIYPLLSIIAGYGAFQLMSVHRYSRVGLILVSVLLIWQMKSAVDSHQDYLAYHNEFARDRAEEFGADSNLDWGQDLKRLTITLKKRNITEFKIKYTSFWGINLDQFKLPISQELEPYKKVTGWIAISIGHLKMGAFEAPYDQFAWLNKYQPVERIGQSILLYHIPE